MIKDNKSITFRKMSLSKDDKEIERRWARVWEVNNLVSIIILWICWILWIILEEEDRKAVLVLVTIEAMSLITIVLVPVVMEILILGES